MTNVIDFSGMQRWPGTQPVSNADGLLGQEQPPPSADDATQGGMGGTGDPPSTSGMFGGLFAPAPAGYVEHAQSLAEKQRELLTGDDALIIVDYQADVIEGMLETNDRLRSRISDLERNLDRERRESNANRGAFVSLTREVDETVVVVDGYGARTLRQILDEPHLRLCQCKDVDCLGCDRRPGVGL